MSDLSYEDILDTRSTIEREETTRLVHDLRNNRGVAVSAAIRWESIAHQLTAYRVHDRVLPDTMDEIGDLSPMQLPFDLADLHRELDNLSGLITKAYTIAALYRDHADWIEDTIDGIENPDTDR